MQRKRDSIASARASQRGKERVADEAESQELGLSFADLSSSITTHILLQLPIKSVLICRCVCRTWNALISSPQFAKLHYERAPVLGVMIQTHDKKPVSRTLHLLEYEPEKFESECSNNHVKLETKFKLPLRGQHGDHRYQGCCTTCKPHDDQFAVVNSCNGLLCLRHPSNGEPLVVCNPVTGEFIRIPEATMIEKIRVPVYAGFGIQPKTNEYKVIRMWNRIRPRPDLGFEGIVVEMNTLGTPTWRSVGEVDPRFYLAPGGIRFPTCVNGALHWISFQLFKWSILCFNFESERFQPFPSPPDVLEKKMIGDLKCISMVELRGFLYICDASSCDSCIMWVMEKYGIGESWTKVFSIDTSDLGRPCWPYGSCWPVKNLKKGAAILMLHSCNCFVYFEPEKYGFNAFWVHGNQSKSLEVIPHIPSLISLKDAVKGDYVEVLNVQSSGCSKFELQEENEVLFLARDCSDGEEHGE